MRVLYLLLAIPFLCLAQDATAQCCLSNCRKGLEISAGYNAARPMGDLSRHTNTAHGISGSVLYYLPKMDQRLGIGLEAATGTYASFTKTQEFGMNGVQTPMDVNYNSNASTYGITARYEYLRINTVTAFAGIKAGIANYASRLSIEDPEDEDGCEAVDTKNLISDNTWMAGAYTGARLDMNTFFRKMPAQNFFLQIYAGYTRGGQVDYINVKKVTTDNHAAHSHSTTNPDGSTPLNVRFINLQTNDMHTHEVARVYTSPVQLMEYNISLVMRL